ncbi:hypothetical protein, partial [Paraburkholderia sp. Ac-20342]|uniref:hypothetical protein n=1 Tax=Paraburkholderia sp. Ac-20342 TaxID=2703889 RepID=UPI0019813E26
APTLIGCWFLKISPLTQPCPTPPGTASFASLRLQQRNEIMLTAPHHVKTLLTISFKKIEELKNRAPWHRIRIS